MNFPNKKGISNNCSFYVCVLVVKKVDGTNIQVFGTNKCTYGTLSLEMLMSYLKNIGPQRLKLPSFSYN